MAVTKLTKKYGASNYSIIASLHVISLGYLRFGDLSDAAKIFSIFPHLFNKSSENGTRFFEDSNK